MDDWTRVLNLNLIFDTFVGPQATEFWKLIHTNRSLVDVINVDIMEMRVGLSLRTKNPIMARELQSI